MMQSYQNRWNFSKLRLSPTSITFGSGLLLLGWLWLFAFTHPVHAQKISQQYLQNCDGSRLCVQGLVCARQSGTPTGVCVHSCNPGDSTTGCPHGEPCNSQMAIPGACICLSNAQCNKGACKGGKCSCLNGQCVGKRKLAEVCDDSNPCALGLLCSSVGTKEKRCLKLCIAGASGPICSNRMPCVREGNFTVCRCSEDSHCSATGPGYFCRGGTCVNRLRVGDVCKQSTQCESGLECAFTDFTATEKRCFPRCVTGVDCFAGETCVRPGSVNPVCRCDKNSACPSGSSCVNGLCDLFKRCSPSLPCKDGYACTVPATGSQQGICVKKCRGDKDCSGQKAFCRQSGGIRACFCTSNSHCNSGDKCLNFKCVKGCRTRSDCKFPEFCRKGVCQPAQDGDIIGEPPPTEGKADASAPDAPKPEPKPLSKCKNGCPIGQICNETKAKCEIRIKEIGESCTKPEECKSKLCVNSKSLSICTKACQKPLDCRDVGLECRVIQAQQVCHFPNSVSPEKKTPSRFGCCQVNSEPSLLPLLLLALFGAFTWRRRKFGQGYK